MTDIASLSFQIDSSSVPPATQQLNQLSDAADKVRGSTRFLVTAFGSTNEAITQLATSGRASLSAFEEISQNLDAVTSRLEAFRTAAAQTIGTLAGGQITSALTSFQQQFDSMSTLFGASSAQLESFNRQAQYLGMNSFQVTSALQRITEAMQNITPAGEAIRQSLNLEGINLKADPSNILAQIQQYAGAHKNSQLAYNTLQEILGPIDPSTDARLLHEPYFTVAQRRQQFVSNTLDTQAAATSAQTAQVNYQNNYDKSAYDDGRKYLDYAAQTDYSGKGRLAFIDEIKKQIQRDSANDPSKAAQERQQLLLLQGAQSGSQNAIAGESQFAILNPNNPLAASSMTFMGRQSLVGSPINGTPSWYERFTDQNYKNANANSIAAEYDQRRANTGDGITGFIRDAALNTDEISNIFANRLGLYTPGQGEGRVALRGRGGVRYSTSDGLARLVGAPAYVDPFAKGAQPVGANEKYLTDSSEAQLGQQFGYGGFSERIAALSALSGLNDQAPGSVASKLYDLFGSTEGGAIVSQQRGVQQYIANNAATPGFDQLQGLRTQGFLASQTTGQGRANALVSFAKSLGLDTGRFQGMGVDNIINGVGPAGATLTGGQRSAFNSIFGQYLGNEKISQDASFLDQSSLSTTMLGAASTANGQGNYDAQVAGIKAYREELTKTGDAARSLEAFQNAVTLTLKNQAVAAELATKALQEQNAQAQKALATGGLALGTGQPGAYGAATAENQIQAQVAQFKLANPAGDAAAYERQLRNQQQNSLLSGAQDALSQVQNRAFSAQGSLGALASGGGSSASNLASTQLEFASQLATATGDTRTALEQTVQSITAFKDSIDQTQQAMADLQSAISGFSQGSAYDAAMAAPPGQQAAVLASYNAKARILNSTNPLAMLSPAALKDLQPHMADIQNAARHFDIPASFLGADLFMESSGNPNAANGDAVGYGQMTSGTGAQYGLVGKGFDNRTNATDSINATAAYFADLMKRRGGSWSNPRDRLAVGGDYGTIPKGITPEELRVGGSGYVPGDAAGAGALYSTTESQKFQAMQTGYGTAAATAQTQAEIPLLAAGQTGSASLAASRIIPANIPGPEQSAVLAAQLAQASDALLKATVGITAETKQRTDDAALLAHAYTQGPMAVIQAQAQIQAGQQSRTTARPISTFLPGDVSAAQSAANESAGQFGLSQQSSSDLQRARLQNNQIVDPYSRIAANDAADLQNQLKTTFAGASDAMKSWLTNLEQTKSSLDVVAAKQQVVAEGMGQIGSSVSGTLQNLAFSYQQGPGAGLYAQKQISGLLGSAGRSLFNTVIGTPVSNAVTGGLSDLVNTILGNNTPTGSDTSGSNGFGAPTGSGSGSGQVGGGVNSTLGGLSGLLGSMGTSGLLGDAFHGLQGLLSGGLSGFAAGGGAQLASSAVGGLTSTVGGIGVSGALSAGGGGFGGLLSSLFSLFANGGAFSAGQRIPFAAGDVFNSPTTMPMALMGEAGPEAIMPLRRGADGKLGVVAPGGGGGGHSIVVNAPISVGANALGPGGKMDQRQQQDLQRQLHATITNAVKNVMVDQSRPGGMIQPQSP